MKVDKNVVLVAIAVFAFAWFASHNSGDGWFPNPFVPQRPDRPVLRFIVRAAKTALWFVAFAEPKPPMPPAHGHHRLVQANVGPDGHEYLDHGDL